MIESSILVHVYLQIKIIIPSSIIQCHACIYIYMYASLPPQAIHQRDELAERLAEVEEELTMAVQEIKKLDNANKQMGDVCITVTYAHFLVG